MAKTRGDFTDILLRRQVLSPDQLDEARSIAQQTGAKLADTLVKLGYSSTDQVMSALAEFHGMQFVDLTEVTIPAAVVELVPESVARENVVLPLAQENGALKIIMSDPSDFDTVQKLQFILNKDIQPVLAPREQIIEAINRHYGQSETESVDSMLAEFTDTAIDFTETEGTGNLAGGGDESDAPVVKLVNLVIQEAVSLAPATSTSSRSPTACASVTASTASWSSATVRRAACWRRSIPASRLWGRSTLPRNAGRRTAVSR